MSKGGIGRRIRESRERRHLDVTQVEYLTVAAGMRIPASTLYRIEAGEIDTSATKLATIARVLKVSADYLLGLTDDPEPPVEMRQATRDEIALLADMAAFDDVLHRITELLTYGDEQVWGRIESYLLFLLSESGKLPNSSDLSDSNQET